MKLMLDVDIKTPKCSINYSDKILVIGSCFTEHIGGRLQDLKFQILQNPNGILFDPLSVAQSLNSYLNTKLYEPDDLILLNELWQSWHHHSKFSGPDQQHVLDTINVSQQQAHQFLLEADWLIITLGSAFYYRLIESGFNVANCHRASGRWFDKMMISTDEIIKTFAHTIAEIRERNPALKIIFTVSPVRHIRDGVIENNRSKARLIEAVHTLVERTENVYYFPAYEIVIDVLRDHRFYDIDLVHPNYAATEFVFEKFTSSFISNESRLMMQEFKKIVTAFRHKPFHAASSAHKVFMEKTLQQANELQAQFPFLDLSNEIRFFRGEKL